MSKLLKSLLVISLLCIPSTVTAQATFAGGAYCGDVTGTTYNCPVSPTLTGGAGSVLYIGVQGSQTGSDLSSGCSFNGSAATSAASGLQGTAGTRWIHVWRLATPAAGAHTLTCTSSSSDYMQVSWIEYTGACTTTPEDVALGTDTSASTLTFQGHVTPANSSTRIISFMRDDSNSGPILASAGNTKRVDDTDWDSFAWLELTATGTSGVQSTVQGVATTAVAGPFAALTIAIRASGCAAASGPPSGLSMMGVGN